MGRQHTQKQAAAGGGNTAAAAAILSAGDEPLSTYDERASESATLSTYDDALIRMRATTEHWKRCLLPFWEDRNRSTRAQLVNGVLTHELGPLSEMLVCRPARLAVIHIYKNAGTTLKRALDDNCRVYGDGDDEEQWDGAWVTLAVALPLLPALHELGASCVMNDARLMALVAVLPRGSATLVKLHLTPVPGLDLGEAACSAAQAAWGTRPSNGLIH